MKEVLTFIAAGIGALFAGGIAIWFTYLMIASWL